MGIKEFPRYIVYRITAVLKIEIDIVASITASPTGWAVTLLIMTMYMYVKIFNTGIIVFVGDVKCVLRHTDW